MKKVVLSFLHTNYTKNSAGIEKVVHEQQKYANEKGINYLAVYPILTVIKVAGRFGIRLRYRYNVLLNGELIIEQIKFSELNKLLLNKYDIQSFYLHSLVYWKKSNQLIQLIRKIDCEKYFMVHDLSSICHNYLMTRNKKEFCGITRVSYKKCHNCIYYMAGKKSYKFYISLLDTVKNINIVFPSDTMKYNWNKVFGERDREHTIPNSIFDDSRIEINHKIDNEHIKIAYVGNQLVTKGWNVWTKICSEFSNGYSLIQLGNSERTIENIVSVYVSNNDGEENMMTNVIKRNNIDIALLWSTIPESYSFTFFEAYIGGAFIITNKHSGNIACMVEKYKCGIICDNEKELIELLNDKDRLMNLINTYFYKLKVPKTMGFNPDLLKITNKRETESSK